MGKINVEIEELSKEAKLMDNYSEEINEIINNFNLSLSKLGDSWKDSDYENFVKINELKLNQLKQTKEQFEYTSNLLKAKVNVASKYFAVYSLHTENTEFSNMNTPIKENTIVKNTDKFENKKDLKEKLKSNEVIIDGEKLYKPFGKYVGKLKGLKEQTNQEMKCHDEKGTLTFRSGNIFVGKFEEDMPVSGELTFKDNEYLEKYIGQVKCEGAGFANNGLGRIIFHKNKFKLGEFLNSDIEKNKFIEDICKKWVVSYEGELDRNFMLHGKGIITIKGIVDDSKKELCIEANEGKVNKIILISDKKRKYIKRNPQNKVKEIKRFSSLSNKIVRKINESLPRNAALSARSIAKSILEEEKDSIKLEDLLDKMLLKFDQISSDVAEHLGKVLGGTAGIVVGGTMVFNQTLAPGLVLAANCLGMSKINGKSMADRVAKAVEGVTKFGYSCKSEEEKIRCIKNLLYNYKRKKDEGRSNEDEEGDFYIKDHDWNKIIWE